jgi:hypothetical protein
LLVTARTGGCQAIAFTFKRGWAPGEKQDDNQAPLSVGGENMGHKNSGHILLNRLFGSNDGLASCNLKAFVGDGLGRVSDHTRIADNALTVGVVFRLPPEDNFNFSAPVNVTIVGDAGGNISGHVRGGDNSLTTDLTFAFPQPFPFPSTFDFSSSVHVDQYGDAVGNLSGHAHVGDNSLNVQLIIGDAFPH